jgi:hypothetical protein
MIPVHRWEVCVVSPQTFKFLKCCYPFQLLKRSKFAAGHFHITTQLLSVRSDDSIIYSITSRLHRFCYIHFASVRYNDPIPAASAVIIDYNTLPLRGNPIHIVCDIPADRQQHLPHALIRMEVIYRRISSFSQSGSAGSKIIGPSTSHLRCDIKIPRREFNNFKKLKRKTTF